MTSATSLKAMHLTHRYIGVFFGPTILFFAITGSLQMFGVLLAGVACPLLLLFL